MAADCAYFDTAFLFRLYWEDPGWEVVRRFAAGRKHLVCAAHGCAEIYSCIHRKRREGAATDDVVAAVLGQFELDCRSGGVVWVPLTDPIFRRVEEVFRNAPASLALRAADALHLATAQESGCHEIYSNDRHLLAAAPSFGLEGVNLKKGSVPTNEH